jgi:hypothetical protein
LPKEARRGGVVNISLSTILVTLSFLLQGCFGKGADAPQELDESGNVIVSGSTGSGSVPIEPVDDPNSSLHEGEDEMPPAWVVIPGAAMAQADVLFEANVLAIDETPDETPEYSIDLNSSSCDNGSWIALSINIDPILGYISGIPSTEDIGACVLMVKATSGLVPT